MRTAINALAAGLAFAILGPPLAALLLLFIFELTVSWSSGRFDVDHIPWMMQAFIWFGWAYGAPPAFFTGMTTYLVARRSSRRVMVLQAFLIGAAFSALNTLFLDPSLLSEPSQGNALFDAVWYGAAGGIAAAVCSLMFRTYPIAPSTGVTQSA